MICIKRAGYTSRDSSGHTVVYICKSNSDHDKSVKESHSYGSWQYYNADIHKRYCSVCNYSGSSDQGSHSGTATCTSSAYCSTCSTTWKSALGHNYTSSVTTAATCTTNGVRTYRCSRCSTSYTEAITATGHSEPSTWTQTADTHYKTCSTCQAQITSTLAEHADSNGDGSCDTCGYSMLPVPTITLSLSVIRTAPSNTMGYHYQYTGDGEVTVTVGSSSIATASIDTTNSNIIVTGVSDGETTLTISAPATSNYAATTATITIKVATPTLMAETYENAVTNKYIFGNTTITQRRGDILKISIEDSIPSTLPSGAWDVSSTGNGGVYAWFTTNTTDSAKYDLHIAGSSKVILSNGYCLFKDYTNCIEINGLTNLSTSSVTNMSYMFSNIKATTLDLTSFNTSNVTTMGGMFEWAYYLTSINFGSGFDTSKVGQMWYMFCGCGHLEELNLSGFDTSSVTNMNSMFSSCGTLENLDLSSFDTSSVQDMGEMFSYCTNLKSITMSADFDVSAATDMHNMFLNCTSLTSIPTGLDLGNTNITAVGGANQGYARMFYGCSSLTSARINSKYIGYQMFYGCNNLTNITIASDVQGVYANSDCFKYTGSGTLETKVLSFSSAMSDYEWTTDSRSLITPDTLAPVGTISLGSTHSETNGYVYVNSNIVTINLTATDNETSESNIEVALINEDNYDKTKSNSSIVWQAFSPSIQWTTSNGGGLKYVYVIFKDEAGNQTVYFA